MKNLIIVALFSASAGNASAQSMSTEAAAAHKVALQCLYQYSVKLDDGISSVESVAKIVANSCQRESAQFVDVWTAGANVDKRQILDKMYSTSIDSASYYILTNRSAKK